MDVGLQTRPCGAVAIFRMIYVMKISTAGQTRRFVHATYV